MNRKRKEGETFEDYKNNLKQEDLELKKVLRGKLVWNASNLIFDRGFRVEQVQGTYCHRLHGELSGS